MKEIIIRGLQNPNSITYRLLNSFILGLILFFVSTLFQLTFRQTDEYFVYHSITPTTTDFGTGDLTFVSSITRYKETNMRFNDTLFCGFNPNDIFWYSQSNDEYNSAPAGEFLSKWVYGGEKPTTKMYCKLRSAPYVSLPFGIDTKPQFIETSQFTVN